MGYERRKFVDCLDDRSLRMMLDVFSHQVETRDQWLTRKTRRGLENLIEQGFVNPPYHNKKLPDVFVCHSSREKRFARKMVKDITSQGYKVWFDEFTMRPGESMYEKIQLGIKNSLWFLIILSPRSVKSQWCRRELNNALQEEFERGRNYVVPILYKKCDVPVLIKEKVYVSCQGRKYNRGLAQILDLFSGAGNV
jgi:hypothetical protein